MSTEGPIGYLPTFGTAAARRMAKWQLAEWLMAKWNWQMAKW
jgi:hypothetical protein